MIIHFKKQILFALLISIPFCIFSQRKNFISDNGFSGFFEMEDEKLKPNSITITRLKTSVGEFSGNDLESQGILFPFECIDCSFDIKNPGDIVNVENTFGPGFHEIIVAARTFVKKKDDDLVIAACLKKIEDVDSEEEKKRILFSAYRRVYDKRRIENLIVRLNNSKSEDSTNADEVLKAEEPIVLSNSAELEKMGSPKNPNASTNQDSFLARKPNTGKFSKCQQKFLALSQRRNKALTNNDLVIIGELDMALNRLKKKCDVSPLSSAYKQITSQPKPNTRATVQKEDIKKRVDTLLLSKKKVITEQKPTEMDSHSQRSVETKEKEISVTKFQISSFEGMTMQQLTEKEQLHRKTIIELENQIVNASKSSNFDAAEKLMIKIASERQNYRLVLKELRKIRRNSGRSIARVTKGTFKQIDSPRIFF